MTSEHINADGGFAIRLVEYVRTSLSNNGLKFSTTSSDTVQVLMFSGSKFEITMRIFCGDTYLTLHGTLPVTISAEVLPELLIYLNSLNITTPIGSYEIHPEFRLVAFKVGMCVPPEPTSDQLSTVVDLVLHYLDSISSEVLKFGVR